MLWLLVLGLIQEFTTIAHLHDIHLVGNTEMENFEVDVNYVRFFRPAGEISALENNLKC